MSPYSWLLSPISCHLFPFSCLLLPVSSLLSTVLVSCHPSPVSCHTSPIDHPYALSPVTHLLYLVVCVFSSLFCSHLLSHITVGTGFASSWLRDIFRVHVCWQITLFTALFTCYHVWASIRLNIKTWNKMKNNWRYTFLLLIWGQLGWQTSFSTPVTLGGCNSDQSGFTTVNS